jgi:hypothetical protein
MLGIQKEGIVIAKEEVIYTGRYMNREINKSQLAKELKNIRGIKNNENFETR